MPTPERQPPQSDPAIQAEVVRFLSDPASYGGPAAPVERIDTHAAMVFLAGPDAYKIKRAVRYNYLDFSTLERRRCAIEHEFEVNRSNAPGIYLGAVPIARGADGKLSFGGRGEVVEWALHMRRFATGAILSNRYAADAPPDAEVDALAAAVVELHKGALRVVGPGSAARIGAIIEELQEALGEFADLLPANGVGKFIDRARTDLDRVALRLKLRGRRGCIRRCHGDLHLGNIVTIDGRPVLFDALEFDDELATTDVLYDLAFLVMDLDMRGYRRAANLVLNRYLAQTRDDLDLYGLAAMPLFLAVRAGIRAMVALQRGARHNVPMLQEARKYFDKALGYLMPHAPCLIAVGGCSGTGKSTVARGLAPLAGHSPGAVHLSSDVERKSLAGVGELQRLGPEAYAPEISAEVHRRLRCKVARLLKGGVPVIVDATFLAEPERSAIEAMAQRLQVPFIGLWLTTGPAVAVARVEARRNDVSDATTDVVKRQFEGVRPPSGWVAIDGGGTPQDALAAASDAVSNFWRAGIYPSQGSAAAGPGLQTGERTLFCRRWQQLRSEHCPP